MEQHAFSTTQRQAQDSAETVYRIKMFSRRSPKSKFTYCFLNDLVRYVVESMEHPWSSDSGNPWSGIQLEAYLQWVPPMYAHVPGLKEAISSLVEDAVAVLPEGGKVPLRTRCVNLSELGGGRQRVWH